MDTIPPNLEDYIWSETASLAPIYEQAAELRAELTSVDHRVAELESMAQDGTATPEQLEELKKAKVKRRSVFQNCVKVEGALNFKNRKIDVAVELYKAGV